MVNRIQNLLDRVPGYSGYRDKERRRDEDKRVRVTVADSIDQIAVKVQDAGRALANARQLQDIQTVESLYQRITLLGNRIRNATYGYAGLFDEVKVDEAALDQLGRFDRRMGTELAALDAAASGVQAAGSDPGSIGQAVANANAELARLEALWDGRAAVIATGQPTSDQKALALLDATTAPPRTTPAAPQLRPGAALSILGENFIVDLTMTVSGDGETLNLARIGANDWLLQASGQTVLAGRLKEASATGSPASVAKLSGRCTITAKDGSAQTTAVAFTLQTSGANDADVSVQIDFGNETRTLTGNKIAMDDVEIYGQPAL